MKVPSARSATDALARPAGFLFLLLIPLVTLIPYERVPVWLAQDLALRWGALLVFLFLTGGIFLKAKGSQAFTFDLPSTLLLALAGWVLLSTKNSLHSFDSFYGFKSFVALLLWWFSLRLLWERVPGAFAWFERVFFWTACVAALWLLAITLGHKFGLKVILENGLYPREGPFPNQNIAAGFLAMFLIWQILRALHKEKVQWVWFALVFLAWGLTESRGALVAMAFTAIVYLVIHMREVEAKLRRWGAREWGWFALASVLLLVPLSFMLNRLFHFLGDLGDDPRSFFRLDIWLVSLQMIKTQPLLGFGPGTFGDVFANFRPGTFWNVGTNFAHNEYLQVGAECGLPALFLLLLFMAALFYGFFGVVRKAKAFLPLDRVPGTAEVAFFLLLLGSFHCLVDFAFHEWSHRLVLLAFLTRGLAGTSKDLSLSLTLRSTRSIFWALGILLTFLLVWCLGVGGLRDYAAQTHAYQAAWAVAKGKMDEAEVLSRKALRVRGNFPVAWDALGTLERAKGEASASAPKKEKHFRQADEYFRKAIALSPYTQAFLEHQVQAMFARGRLEQALDLQVALVERFPRLPNQYKNLALVLMKLGRPQGALAAAQRSIELDHYYIPGHSLKGQALMALARWREALATFEEEKKVLERMGRVDPTGQVEAHIKLLKAKLGDKN